MSNTIPYGSDFDFVQKVSYISNDSGAYTTL